MKACIFDLDGTLTNTLESMTYSVNLTLKEMGLSQITKDQCRMFVGNGARVLIEESLKVSGDPKASRIEEGMKIYGRIFDQNCTCNTLRGDSGDVKSIERQRNPSGSPFE